MRPGPKLISQIVCNTLELDAPPRRLDEVVLQIVQDHPEWERDPYYAVERWLKSVQEYLQKHRSQALRDGRQPKVAFNTSSPYMVQGPCFVEPRDSDAVRAHKEKRLHWKDYYQALRSLAPLEFEVLCKKMLGLLGVRGPQLTSYTADEGIDFYGRLSLGDLVAGDVSPYFPVFESAMEVWLVGQAKHYSKNKVATPDIRDLVGATNLGRARVFGAPDDTKYPDLKIRVCDPVFMLFFTTGEISSYGWTLVRRSGVVAMDGEMVAAFLADKGVGVTNQADGKRFDPDVFRDWLSV